jgi:hypothetical protein
MEEYIQVDNSYVHPFSHAASHVFHLSQRGDYKCHAYIDSADQDAEDTKLQGKNNAHLSKR